MARSRADGLGPFIGVYTPSILTILGVVLFLRTGWVVGQVGLTAALTIVVLAHVITIATALSVSAIATNMNVGAGGAYFIISRSLGIEIGGAVGLPLFLAQTFSVALYAFGLVESLELFWPDIPAQPAAAAIVVAVTLISLRGADFALRMQLPIMGAIGLALLSLFVGAARNAQPVLPLGSTGDGANFWFVFAVFFPAVTGLMAGVSLSGELRDPARSIVRGTLAAVATGLVVYLAVPVALALAADGETLRTNRLIWFDIAAVPLLIYPGLFGAIFSSAVGSILGAPQTLEALSRDRILPTLPRTFLGRDLGDKPALLLSAAVALAAVGLGGLDAIAPVLTMFFLTTYGVINLVAGLEQLSGAPSYRPRLHVPWWISLLGAAGCIWVMMLINSFAAVAAFALEIGVYVVLRRRAINASWGDLRHGALLSLVRSCLIALRRMPEDPRNWRPHILLMANDPRRRIELVRFADWLNQRRGILTVSQLLEGRIDDLATQAREQQATIERFLDEQGIVAFAETDVVSDFVNGAVSVAQANGIAGLESNTIMFGWSDRRERLRDTLTVIDQVAQLGKSGVVCKIVGRRWGTNPRRIDVWWRGMRSNGDLILLFAHLLSLNPEWRGVTVVLKSIATSDMMAETTAAQLAELITRNRIDAESKVLRLSGDETVQDVIQRESGDADVVLMGLPEVRPGDEDAAVDRLESLVGDLPTVIMVRAAGTYAGELLDSGRTEA